MKRIKQRTRNLLTRWWHYVDKRISYYRNIGNLDGLGPYVSVGRHSYGVTSHTILLARSANPPTVTIGSFCSIAPGAVILANADHELDLPSTYPFRTLLFRSGHEGGLDYDNYDVVSRGNVDIGHDVWIGQNALILSGVSIGTGAVIGAGSIVTKNVPPYAIAVGNPAKVVRYRFPPEIIVKLLSSEWWLLPDDELKKLEKYFYSKDIEAFLAQVAKQKA